MGMILQGVAPMRHRINILLLSIGLVMSSSAFSAYGIFEDIQATCYIFKNNQLSQKQSCIYGGVSGRDVDDKTSTSIDQKDFIFANGQKIKTTNHIEIAHDSERIISKEITLNQDKAKIYYRNLSFKVINQSQAERRWDRVLVCYKSTRLDFCYGK